MRPFRNLQETEKSGSFFSLHESKDNPKFVVKEFNNPSSLIDYERTAEQVATAIQYYINILRNSATAEHVPNTQVVRGSQEGPDGNETIYLISEKIDGERVHYVSEEEKQQVIAIAKALCQVYCETFNGRNGLIPEINKTDNYLKGKNLNNSKDGVFFVDVFPIYHETIDGLKDRLKRLCDTADMRVGYEVFQDIFNQLDKLQ